MFERIIRFAIEQRWLVMLAVLGMAGIGVYSYQRLPIDAVPDITNVQVQINTEAPGYSPLETEQRITFPIETVMAGLPGLEQTRSLSRYGLSQVTVDLRGRHRHLLRAPAGQRAHAGGARAAAGGHRARAWGRSPPAWARSSCGPSRPKDGAKKPDGTPYTPTDLREIQDWIIKPQLRNVPGVTEINSIGGFDKAVPGRARPGAARRLRPDARRRGRGAGAQQRQRRRRLHRAARRAVPDPRAGPGRRRSTTSRNIVVASRDGVPIRVARRRRGRHRPGAAHRRGHRRTATRWCWAPSSC